MISGPCRPTTGFRPIADLLPRLVRDLIHLDPALPRDLAPDTRRVSPSIVARTMLCGLVEPRLLVRMSVMPAHSSTARTGPPAMTPVPVAAGLSSTRPAPWWPTTSCGIVEPVRGSSTIAALGGLDRLAHRLGDFVRLAGGDADPALAIADGDQGVEGEAPAALHDLGDAVDRDHVLDELAGTVAVAIPVAPAAAALRRPDRRRARPGPASPPRPPGRSARSARPAARWLRAAVAELVVAALAMLELQSPSRAPSATALTRP